LLSLLIKNPLISICCWFYWVAIVQNIDNENANPTLYVPDS
jgi:hypothetical protein